MALLGEIDALADDIVAAVFYLCDETITSFHAVAHGNRIRAPDAAQPEIALYLTIDSWSVVRQDGVPTASILNDESFH